MNNKVTASSDRVVSVYRGDKELISGSTYYPSGKIPHILEYVQMTLSRRTCFLIV
jgi:hypothetical protein